ncbi:MAG: phenazine biosynthesis protein PhzF family [Frankiales bacterium]|nr:phenazine biosynthesis protein PhzF family [Frankiales bacterium]
MSELDYQVVDVFTDTAFTGNPLAVVLGADDLTTAQLQALANEFQLSETAFPMAADDGADYRLRIFTPAMELPFAGHPSVGAAWVLLQRGTIEPGPVVQSCGAGLLPLSVSADAVTLTGGVPSTGFPRDPAGLLAGVGLGPEDLDGVPRDASCGLGFTYLPVVADALTRLDVDLAALKRLGLADGPFGGLSVVTWDGTSARCRVFAFEAGVAEDPATGSAALGLGAYLVASGLVAGDGETAYEVVQGVEMGRPSRLSCVVTAVDGAAVSCRVSGAVVPVASGRVRVP